MPRCSLGGEGGSREEEREGESERAFYSRCDGRTTAFISADKTQSHTSGSDAFRCTAAIQLHDLCLVARQRLWENSSSNIHGSKADWADSEFEAACGNGNKGRRLLSRNPSEGPVLGKSERRHSCNLDGAKMFMHCGKNKFQSQF